MKDKDSESVTPQPQMVSLLHYTSRLLRWIKRLLWLTIACLLLSCALMLVLGDSLWNVNDNYYSAFLWYTILMGLWLLVLFLPTLGVIVLYLWRKRQPVWPAIKVQALLCLLSIGSFVLLYLCCQSIQGHS